MRRTARIHAVVTKLSPEELADLKARAAAAGEASTSDFVRLAIGFTRRRRAPRPTASTSRPGSLA